MNAIQPGFLHSVQPFIAANAAHANIVKCLKGFYPVVLWSGTGCAISDVLLTYFFHCVELKQYICCSYRGRQSGFSGNCLSAGHCVYRVLP